MNPAKRAPDRRYRAAGEFADDLCRHLAGRPVRARNDTVIYRAAKFISRNKLGVSAAVIVLITLLGGVFATQRQARRADRRFQDVRRLAHSVLFDYHDAIARLPGSTAVREKLVRDSLIYLDGLAQEDARDASLQHEIALASPGNLDLARDFSVSCRKLSQLHMRRGTWAESLAVQRKGTAAVQRLIAKEGANTTNQQLLAKSYVAEGKALYEGGQSPSSTHCAPGWRASRRRLPFARRSRPPNRTTASCATKYP